MEELNTQEVEAKTTCIEVTDIKGTIGKLFNAVKSLFGDSDIRVGVKNQKIDADINISKDNLQLNLKKAAKKDT